jgi:hypothetical protein
MIRFCTAVLLLVGTASISVTLPAHAMRVNVTGNHTVDMHFQCGNFCGNYWTVKAGDWVARPGEAGTLKATFQGNAAVMCQMDVQAHEEVTVKAVKNGENSTISCER